MIATGLDHAGVAVHDLDAAARAWQELGFQVTATAAHLPGGTTGNRCVMFARGYVELLGIIDPAGNSATLARFLARYQGIHVLSLTTANAEAAGQRLSREVIRSERQTPDGTARFARVALTELEPRVQIIEHLTPDLVWRAPDLVHPNGASALRAIVMTAANPASAAADLSRAAGVPVVPDPDGGFALRLADGEIRILADLAPVFPGLAVPHLPFVAGLFIAAPAQAGHIAQASGVAIKFVV